MKASLRSLFPSLLALCCLTSCSIGYDSKWKKAAAADATKRPTDLSGAWVGTWKNHTGGHEGGLWAIATPVHTDPKRVPLYQFQYKATWGKMFSGVFTTEHEATRKGSSQTSTLGGGKDLGMLGGKITFTGNATPTQFRAQYDSKANKGVFVLKRPQFE